MGLLGIFRKAVPKRKKEPEKPYIPFEPQKTIKGRYEDFYRHILGTSLIVLITGKRGSGKTALGMKFLEMFRKETKRKTYAMGFDDAKLPRWVKKISSINDASNNSVLLVDEGGIMFSSRDSMKKANKFLSKVMAIARHRGLTCFVISQNSAMLELNVLRLADMVLLKEPSLLQAKFERKAIRDMYKKVKPLFGEFKNRKKFFYIWSDEFEGMTKYDLPEFWTDSISKAFSKLD